MTTTIKNIRFNWKRFMAISAVLSVLWAIIEVTIILRDFRRDQIQILETVDRIENLVRKEFP